MNLSVALICVLLNDNIINYYWFRKDVEGSYFGPLWDKIPVNAWTKWGKLKICQVNQFPGQNLNLRPLEYEWGVPTPWLWGMLKQTVMLTCWVSLFHIWLAACSDSVDILNYFSYNFFLSFAFLKNARNIIALRPIVSLSVIGLRMEPSHSFLL